MPLWDRNLDLPLLESWFSTMRSSDSPDKDVTPPPAGAGASLATASSAPAWLEAALKPIHHRLGHMEVCIRNIEARQLNAMAIEQGDPLVVLLTPSGKVPPNFPATRRDLHDLSNTTVKTLLTHYQQPISPDPTLRRHRLKQYVGIRK